MLSIILLVLRLINNDKEPFCSRSKSRKYNNSNKYVAIAERLTDVAFYIRGVSDGKRLCGSLFAQNLQRVVDCSF